MRFQLQSNNNLNKQKEATMAKTKDKSDRRDSDKKKKVEKSSGIQPFLFTPEEWPKDAPEQIIETTEVPCPVLVYRVEASYV